MGYSSYVYEVRWLGPKKICSGCYPYLAVEVSKGTTVCRKCAEAARIRTTHCGVIHMFLIRLRKCPQLQSVVPSDRSKNGLIPGNGVMPSPTPR